MTDTTRSDVDAIYGSRGMTDSDADALVDQANRLADDVFGGTTRTLSEIEGNVKDFKTLLAAHLWALREGEAQSENQAGGSVTYNVAQGDISDSLSETRYGRMAQAYIRDGASIAVEVARRR